jgi:hypothetical protein
VIYEEFFRGYTRKQWGLDPSQLDAQVTARVPARTNDDDRYFGDTYQAMPLDGYTPMFERMLSHPSVEIMGALVVQYRATVMVMRAIREVIPGALLVQTEDIGKPYATPALAYQAAFEDERRWLSFDLLCGRVDDDHPLRGHLTWAGVPDEDCAGSGTIPVHPTCWASTTT